MNVAFCGMICDRANRRRPSRRKPCSNAALCSINPTWTALGLKPMANHLNCGTVYYKRTSVMQGSWPLKLSLLPALTFKELQECEISDSLCRLMFVYCRYESTSAELIYCRY